MHTYIHAYKHTYIHVYVHTCIQTYLHTYVQNYIHVVHACTHTYMHAYMYTFTYIHTYLHTCVHRPHLQYWHRNCFLCQTQPDQSATTKSTAVTTISFSRGNRWSVTSRATCSSKQDSITKTCMGPASCLSERSPKGLVLLHSFCLSVSVCFSPSGEGGSGPCGQGEGGQKLNFCGRHKWTTPMIMILNYREFGHCHINRHLMNPKKSIYNNSAVI